jgi:hypothetical protein
MAKPNKKVVAQPIAEDSPAVNKGLTRGALFAAQSSSADHRWNEEVEKERSHDVKNVLIKVNHD